ncbi:MAG TPA: hypothetical protein VF891_00465 [Gaiellaceae bacterium]
MHEKRRYVKLAWIGLASAVALALPSPGGAEIVAPTLGRGFLAVGPDGSPRVAFFSGRDVVVARRVTSGWTFAGRGQLLTGNGVIEGLVVDGKARTSLLVAAEDGSWLAFADRGRKLRIVARPRRGASFGPAGLALDAADRPAFAYAVRLRTGKTYLRLVTTDIRGRLRTRAITKQGFPSSVLAPGAAPVLVRGRLHVVETYSSAAIDWQPQPKDRWVGQYLFASRAGSPAGRVGAVADGGTLWSGWTQASSGSVSVLLTLSAATQETNTILDHGIFVSLLVDAGRPEVGAYDWVQLGDWFGYAGVLADESGPFTEVDGLIEGYVAAPGGRRQLLLSTNNGLEWFEAPARPSIRVSLSAEPTGKLKGRVEGASGGLVHVYREAPNGPRTLIANAELAPDGSFTAEAAPPASPTFYRAVYVEQATAIPYASLLRTAVG